MNHQNEPIVAEPVEIRVRFNKKRMESIAPDGTPMVLDGLLVVRNEIPIDSIVWEGRLSEHDILNLAVEHEYWQVVTHHNVKDIKGRVTRMEPGLRRFRGFLPEIGT